MKPTFLFPMLAVAYGMTPNAALAQGNCSQTQVKVSPTCVIDHFDGNYTMVYKLSPEGASSCTMSRTSMNNGWGFPSYIRGYTNESNPGHQPRPYTMAPKEATQQDYIVTQSPSTFVCLRNIGMDQNQSLNSELTTQFFGAPTTTQYVVSEGSIRGELCSSKESTGTLSASEYDNLTYACNAPVILPVKLTQFNANQKGNSIKLSWESASEINLAYYSVERSQTGQSFSEVARVEAGAKPSSTQKYEHTDLDVTGVNRVYYRLKMVDMDGRSEYSRVLMVSLNSKAGAQTLYPNPAPVYSNLTLTVQSPISTQAQIRILDANGRTLRAISTQLSAGTQTVSLQGMSKSGLYLVEVQTESQKTTHRVLVQ
jgi:hypothetical protein